MKRISVSILSLVLFFTSINISFAFEQKTNANDVFSGISNVFRVQYELYQRTKYNVVNICDIVVKDFQSLTVNNNGKKSFIDLQKLILVSREVLLLSNTVVVLTKKLSVNYKVIRIPLTKTFVLLFIFMFLLRYLGLLRVFWIKIYQLNFFKKAYVLYMLSFIFNKKTISIFTVSCFLFSVLTSNLSASVLQGDLSFEKNELFSKDFGKVTEIVNNNSDLLVVNIQDLHSNSSVQLNINNILGSIDKQYKIKQIFIEGGYGNVDISWLYKIQDAKIRNNLVEALLQNGRLTGSEYFAYKTNQESVLKGLEDEQTHKDNLKRLVLIIDKQDFYKSKLQKIKSDIDFINAKYSASKNLRLNKIIDKYNNGDIDSAKFYKLLFKLAKDINENPKIYDNVFSVDLLNFPNINKYINLNIAKINNKKLSTEINLFLNAVKSKISYSLYAEIVKNTNSFSDTNKLVQYIQSVSDAYKIDLAKYYPTLYIYVNSSISANSINPVELVNEERTLLNNLRQAFSKNNTEYEVSFLADFYDVFKNYLTNNLTANNYDYFLNKINKFKNIYSKYAVVDRLTDLTNDFDMLDKYYSINNMRNGIFINNMLAGREITHDTPDLNKNIFQQAKEIIVVIAGGYHTKGIGQLLQDKQISYITIMPNVEGGIEQSEKYYKDIIREETNIETNALSFTVASSTNDFNQFKWGVVSGIQYLNKVYSKDNIEKVVESMKYLVKDKVILNFTEEKTEITVGDRKMVLLNYEGQMRTSEDIDKNKFQPTTNSINGFGINALFEKYPALDFSNDGLEFKLRNLEKFSITEIKGIDLAVIARLPSLFQEYLYETLPDAVKANAEKLSVQETIEKHDKTPKLLEELESMFIERTKATRDYLQLQEEILPMHLQILRDRVGDTQLFINPLKKDLKELLKSNINKVQYTYITAVLFFISAITEDFTDVVNMTDSKCDINLLKDFMAVGVVPVSAVEKYVDKEIEDGRINTAEREKRIALLIDIIYSKTPPASILGEEYKNVSHIWEWIYNLPFSSVISNFIKKAGIKSIAEKETFNQSISLGKKSALTILFDTVSSLASISGIVFGILTGTLPLIMISVLIYSLSRGVIFSTAHSKVTDKKDKVKLFGLGTGFTLISAIPVMIGFATLPVLVPVLFAIGQLLSAQIHKLYNTGLITAYMKGKKLSLNQILAAGLIIAVLAAGGIFANNYFENQYNIQYAEYMQLQQEIINLEKNNFDIIFLKYINSKNFTRQDINDVKILQEFFNANIDAGTQEKFIESLLYIRGEITSFDSVLMPTIDDSLFVFAWKEVLQSVDEIIADNLTFIEKDKALNAELMKVYSDDEISYLNILSLRNDTEGLIGIINSKKDMHYRFYAYMLLNAKDGTKAGALFNKDEMLQYLDAKYILREPSIKFIDIQNSFQWQALCGMMNFVTDAGEDYESILKDARIVKPGQAQISNANLSYVISGDNITTNPIFVAAHEVAHIRFLNILGINENIETYKVSELYAELEAVQVESKVSLEMRYTGDKTIKDINETTDEYSIAYIVIEEVRKAVGIDSANLLQDSIIEYLQGIKEVPAQNIQKTLKDVIEIFAGKVADREISEGNITSGSRQEKIQEIIDKLIGSVSSVTDSDSSLSSVDQLNTNPVKSAQANPYGLMGLLFSGAFLTTDKKKKLKQYKNLDYVISEFEKQPAFFKTIYKIKFKVMSDGLTASFKHGFFGKTETVFVPDTISKEEAYTIIRGLITEYVPTDFKGNVHYYTQFFKRDIRSTIYAPLFKHNENGQYGFVIEMLKDKIAKGDRTFRFWSCGAATGEELRTFAWLVRKALNELNENIDDWKLDFYGTDNNKTTAEIATNFKGKDYIDGRELTADTSGFNIRYIMLNHTNMTDLSNWLAWQKEEGGFDLICQQLNNPTLKAQQEAVTKEVMHKHSLYIHHNAIYNSSNELENIDKYFIENVDINSFLSDTSESKPEQKTGSANMRQKPAIFRFFKSLPDSILNIFTEKNEKSQKVGAVYRKIFADNIIYNDTEPQLIDGVMYTDIFVIDSVPDNNTVQKLNLKSAGLEINGNGVYIGLIKNTIYLYADNCSYDDIINCVKDSDVINRQIASSINDFYGKKLLPDNLDIIGVKLVSGEKETIKQQNNGLVEIEITSSGARTVYEIAGSYIDIITRYGFVVKESIFRYIDDFNVSKNQKERISDFINIIEQQKNISCQLVFSYETYKQLLADIGIDKFNDILLQAKSKNVLVYVLVQDNIKKNEIKKNTMLLGYVEIINGKYMITDSFTNDTTEALFGADSDTVQKIIALITSNISRQPIILKNSLLKKAINSEQDTTLSGILRDIFAFGKIQNIISAVKSKYTAKKISQTYSIKSLAESFDDKTVGELLRIYSDYVNITPENTNIRLKVYKEIVAMLSEKNKQLKQFFSFNDLADEVQTSKDEMFLEQIIFRISAANELAKNGRETGLKNQEYENVLAQAIKMRTFGLVNDIYDEIDNEFMQVISKNNEFERERILAEYLENNIGQLTQRAFAETEPDSKAVNTLIFLIPFAQANDIEIDITSLALKQHDIMINTRAILSAA
ncbi:MAG: hypothetical protein PHR82_03755 [Endomicrobiaceae bacterium]|nr:hypothetical protein [Endomicrobiaceae bacterium]